MAIRYTNLPDNKSKPFGGAYSVHDREITSYRDETIRMFTVNNNYSEKNAEIIKQDFLQTYKQWMFSNFPLVLVSSAKITSTVFKTETER